MKNVFLIFLFIISLSVISPKQSFAGGGFYSNGLYSTAIKISPIASHDTIPTNALHQKKENKYNSYQNTDNFINDMLISLFWAVIGGFIGSFITILIAKYQQPKLDIIATEKANTDNTYNRPTTTGGRWKFFRVLVINKPVNKFLAPFISRQTAQQASATISIRELKQTMKGRWAGTLELAQANPGDYIRIINFPDPMNIYAGGVKEQLDIFTKNEKEDAAYGWNNEAYINNWRTPRLSMFPGNYTIDVEVIALDGSHVKKTFKAHIAKKIENSYLK